MSKYWILQSDESADVYITATRSIADKAIGIYDFHLVGIIKGWNCSNKGFRSLFYELNGIRASNTKYYKDVEKKFKYENEVNGEYRFVNASEKSL